MPRGFLRSSTRARAVTRVSCTPAIRAGGVSPRCGRSTWRRADGHRGDELLLAYHALAADDFGGAHERAGAGVDGAETTGGVVRVHLRDTPKPLVLRVGRLAPPGSRFAIPGGRWAAVDGDADGLYVLSPWTARWATADARMFERAP